MNKIEIHINNMINKIHIHINVKTYKMIINNEEKNITQDHIDALLRIIRTWNTSYENTDNQIDNETFLINISTEEGIYTIKGNGNYPKNYNLFKDWIGEFYE